MPRQGSNRNKYYLLNYVFVFCVLVLFMNDHYLKYAYPNWLTGKLSDAAGIILLPLLVAFLFPALKRHSIWISAVLFAFWKSAWSQGLIDLYNSFAYVQTSRVVDPTDLYVLLLLPIPRYIIREIDELHYIKIHKVSPVAALIPTILVLMSTEPPPRFYYLRTKGNLWCNSCSITVDYNQDEIVEKLKKADIVFDSITPIPPDAAAHVRGLKDENPHFYRIDQLIIDKDTLRELDFTMRTYSSGKTRIYFTGMRVREDLSDRKLAKQLRKYYKSVLFRELKGKLEN